MLPLEHLRSPITRSQQLDWIVDKLQQLGFETTGWQVGRIQKTLITLFALAGSDLSEVVKAIADMGFSKYAKGDALTMLSKSRYDNDRFLAEYTSGPMTLTSTASIPYVIQEGQLLATTAEGVQFRNTTGGVLSSGSPEAPTTLVLEWKAVLAGLEGVVPPNTVNRLVTSLSGVTISNPGSPWYTVAGKDEEPDEILHLRNATKWATMTVETTRDGYINIALNNGARKVAVADTNPRGPGTIDVYVAAETGLVGASDIAALQWEFSKRAFQTTATWPPNPDSRVWVKHPDVRPLDIQATLYYDPNVTELIIRERALKALREYLRLSPIGGWDYRPGPYNIVQREDLIDVLKSVEGMRTVKMQVPAESYFVSAFDLLAEGNWDLTLIQVTT